MADSDTEVNAGLPEKDLNEATARLRSSRSGKMSHLTRRMNIVNSLMADDEYVDEVKGNLAKFNDMLNEFKGLHLSYIQMLNEEDKKEDLKCWYEPRISQINAFLINVIKWISAIENPDPHSTVPNVPVSSSEFNSNVCPSHEDQLSVISSIRSDRSSRSSRSKSSVSFTASARICAEAERAALLAKAATLQERHALEKQQEQLDQQKEEIRKRRETLEIQTELAANTAKINYLKNAETSVDGNCITNEIQSDAMNAHYDATLEKQSPLVGISGPDIRPKQGVQVQFPVLLSADTSKPSARTSSTAQPQSQHSTLQSTFTQATQHTSQARDQSTLLTSPHQESVNLFSILKKQNELTNILVKQQILSTLPKGNLSVFDGDILQYKSFIHCFEHMIERKTGDNQDRLHFLIQYTRGQAQELVRSCQHMNPNRGYQRAKTLLQEHFGNEYRISCAYMEKALSWPTIKSEDSKALRDFALFLRTCCNAMEELEYMEELDTVSNMRNIVLKLPYKLREKWRAKACKLQCTSRVRTVNLVSFIERQANIISDPIYGNIQDLSSAKVKPKITVNPKSKGTFATNVNVKSHQEPRGPDILCLFCKGYHELKLCSEFGNKIHREKIAFLRQNGVCFGCLMKAGHVSKDCTGRLSCSICKKNHPSVLHIKAEQSVKAPVSSAQVSLRAGEHSGAGDKESSTECMLSIVPVQVKHSKGSKVIYTYAFLDPGSSATFCTKSLISKLNITGRKTNILLRTMSQEKPVSSDVITGLEVSAVDKNNFIALPEVYTQRSMPVDTNSIPTNDDLSRFPYLSEVNILRIKADVELLIGSNVPKALEPWKVVNSQRDGPYAVKTILGWVVNGPLNGSCMKSYPKVTANRTSVINLEELLLQQYNHDFNESSPDKVEMSLEDKKFMTIAENSVNLLDGHYTLNYSEEMTKLEKTSSTGKAFNRQSSIYKLDPVLEDGVLRVGGRLNKSAMPDEAKRPMILPKDHHISTLVLRHIHEHLGHVGRNHILSQLRQKYWIVNANSATRRVISRCVVCRRIRGKMGEQKMADLPKERLRADLPPFSNVGVDYFGPFEVKRGRSHVKRYGVIFTCMSSRAIHLEMAHSMDTDSCINALRRFVCRRGQVTHMRSDNGTNLVGAKNELQKAISDWNQNKIQKAMLQKGVHWSFNPPAASHHGGVWERLIRMVRQILYSILKEQELDDESLETLLCEVEAILNSRPITTVTEDEKDLEALTPNHILLLKTHPAFPPGLFQRSDLYSKRRWKQVQYLADLFWKRWTREYLPLLQERQKWFTVKRGFQKGDVVMVVDSTAPRGSWPLGKILEVQPDSKGLTRAVTLKTKTGVLERPVTKLCLLFEGSEVTE